MNIKADIGTIYSLRNTPPPKGRTIEDSSGAMKAFDVHLNINIDPAEIIKAGTVALWIATASIASLGRGKDVPPLLSYWVIQTGTFHRFHPAALAAEKQRSTDYYE
jgi:hypothetical protein